VSHRLSDALKDRLELPDAGSGRVLVDGVAGSVEVDLSAMGPIGAKVHRVRVESLAPGSLDQQAVGICGRVRGLGERLVAVELDERLGGGMLRSDPGDMRGKRYFEVGLDGRGATLERWKAKPDGGRERESFEVTREQLGRLVDDLAEGLGEP
jgi:hypothetical protein